MPGHDTLWLVNGTNRERMDHRVIKPSGDDRARVGAMNQIDRNTL
jgi:hypothetical protein